MEDRSVFATLADKSEVVRYNRAGKYHHENVPPHGFSYRINLRKAVELALTDGAVVNLHQPGGQAFDREYRKATAT